VKVRRRGGTAILRFTAKDASRVAVTTIRIGTKKARKVRLRRPDRVPVKQLRKLRFASVDVWGNAERPRRLPRGA
jgi:hypothetical protein